MLALKVIEGGKGGETLFSGPEWEGIKRELREIELEIRNFPEDKERELDKNIPRHLGADNRGRILGLLSFASWLSVKEISERLSISERHVALHLKHGWARGVYSRRGVMAKRGRKYLWAVEGTSPY